jgi:hypothetical protein
MGLRPDADSVQAMAFSDLEQIAFNGAMDAHVVDDAEVPGGCSRSDFRRK